MTDPYFDKPEPPPRGPILSDASIYMICKTAVVLAVIVGVFAMAWHDRENGHDILNRAALFAVSMTILYGFAWLIKNVP